MGAREPLATLVAVTSQYAEAPLEPNKYVRNNRYPDAGFQAELGKLINKGALFRGKELARFSTPLETIPDVGGGVGAVRWRFAFHSSPYTNAILVRALMAQTFHESANSPYTRVRILTTAGATVGDAELHFGASTANGNTPDKWGVAWSWVIDPAHATPSSPITGNTELTGVVTDIEDARIISLSVYEAALNVTPPVPENYVAQSKIYDADRQNQLTIARALWKQGAAPFIVWSADHDGAPRTRSSATAINVIDNTSTALSTSTPGFTIQGLRRGRLRSGTINCVMKVYGSSAGAGGTVTLKNARTGVTHGQITNITAAGWYSQTNLTIPANAINNEDKYDLHYAGDGTNTFSLYAVSVYQYASGT